MFGIGFSQLLLIALVALIVIGPERLPKVARSLGVLFGRAQRFAREVKTQVEQDIRLEEIGKIKLDAENNLRAVERSLQEQVFGAEKQAREISRSVEAEIQAAAESLDKPQAGKSPPESGNTAPGAPQSPTGSKANP